MWVPWIEGQTYGKNGASCWLAAAVRTLQKRVEMLEANDSFNNVECSIHTNTSVSRHKSDGDFEIQKTNPKLRVPRHKPAGDLEHGGVISADDDFQDMEKYLSWACLQCMEMASSRY